MNFDLSSENSSKLKELTCRLVEKGKGRRVHDVSVAAATAAADGDQWHWEIKATRRKEKEEMTQKYATFVLISPLSLFFFL